MDVVSKLLSLQLKAYVGDHVILHDTVRDKYSRECVDGVRIRLNKFGNSEIGYLINGSWLSCSEFYSTKEEVISELTNKDYITPEVNISRDLTNILPTLHFGDQIYYRCDDKIKSSELYAVELLIIYKTKITIRYELKNSKVLYPKDAYLSEEDLVDTVSDVLTNLGF